MNTFKKIAAVAMAAATLATTMITASAKDISLGALNPTINYAKAHSIHYSQLHRSHYDNNITYSSVSKSLNKDCVILSIDFTDNGSKVISDTVFSKIKYYMDFMYFRGPDGKLVTEGKFPLVVDAWTLGKNGRVNIVADSNNIFTNLDITNAIFYLGKNYDGNGERDIIQLEYKIKGSAVLPSYKISVGGTACETVFAKNDVSNLGTAKVATTCKVKVSIPHSYIANGETTLPVSINGVKIADITLSPTRSCPVYKNY